MTALGLAPDELRTEPLIAWRIWRVLPYRELDGRRTHRLCAAGRLGIPSAWEPRQAKVATCSDYHSTHAAPWPRHECGIWALPTREAAEEQLAKFMPVQGLVSGWAIGRVSLWGVVIEHERGWRGQYAYPYALVVRSPSAHVATDIRRDYAIDVEYELIGNGVLNAAALAEIRKKHKRERAAAARVRSLTSEIVDIKTQFENQLLQRLEVRGMSWKEYVAQQRNADPLAVSGLDDLSDEQVLDALREAIKRWKCPRNHGAAKSREVAAVLTPNHAPEHGAEVGVRLWVMARAGKVARYRLWHRKHPTLWAPCEATVPIGPGYLEADPILRPLELDDWGAPVTPRVVLAALKRVTKDGSAVVHHREVLAETRREQPGASIAVVAYRLSLLRRHGLAQDVQVDGVRNWTATADGCRVSV